MSEKKGNAFDWSLLKRVLGYTTPYRGLFSLAIVMTVTLSFLSVVRPMLIRHTVNSFIVTPADASHEVVLRNELLVFTIILIGLLLVESILQFTNGYTTSLLGQRIVRDLRAQMHRKVLGFKAKYFDRTPVGTAVTRVVSDIEAINDVFSQGFIVIAGDLLTIIVYMVFMLMVDWRITLVVLTTIPLMFLSTWIFKNAVKKSFTDVRNQVSRLNAFVQEHLTGMRIVQVFNREKVEMDRFKEINKKHRDANVRSVWYYSVFFPVVEILVSVSLGLLVWYAGMRIYGRFADPGDVTFFVLLINQFFRPIRMLADRVNTLQMGMVASERVFKVLDTDDAISNDGTTVAQHLTGKVKFDQVWFAYNDEDWVLRGVSLETKPGEMLAIVGSTGSGKTSIINLLNRSYEYNEGIISIDDINIRDFELSSLRSQIGVVLQDVFLFSDSIHNNITLNNDSISREEVVGGMLSVGQRQLIAFIRAYVYNPSILILDEATSSIDTESEQLIQFATKQLTQGRTSIVIAHRLATIQEADRIIVLDKGTILEVGSHEELIKKNGQYKKLFDLQFSAELVQ